MKNMRSSGNPAETWSGTNGGRGGPPCPVMNAGDVARPPELWGMTPSPPLMSLHNADGMSYDFIFTVSTCHLVHLHVNRFCEAAIYKKPCHNGK